MKKIIMFFAIIWLYPSLNFNLSAQENPEKTWTVQEKDLNPELVEKLKQQQKLNEVKENLDTIKQITSIGKEIGIAINDGLAAVTDNAAKFANTTPGKFTMLMIAWKIMAKDAPTMVNTVIGWFLGPVILTFFWIFMLWHYRKTTIPRNVLIEEKDGVKKYQEKQTWFTKDDADNDATMTYTICWWIVFAGGTLWIIADVIF